MVVVHHLTEEIKVHSPQYPQSLITFWCLCLFRCRCCRFRRRTQVPSQSLCQFSPRFVVAATGVAVIVTGSCENGIRRVTVPVAVAVVVVVIFVISEIAQRL